MTRDLPRLVSVIVPTFNCAHLIEVQLTALAEQDYPGEFEVIVSDNGSTDNLPALLTNHPLAALLNLRCVDSAGVVGASHARNVGIGHARGDFLAFCDADDRAHPNWLTEMVKVASTSDAVGGPIETASLNAPHIAKWLPVPPPDQQGSAAGMFRIVGSCNFGLWRSVFDAVGPWDESYVTGSEDADYCLRLQLAGFGLSHAPKALMAYRVRTSHSEFRKQQSAWAQSQVRIYAQYRDRGAQRPPLTMSPMQLIMLALHNPALPRSLRQLSYGEWLFYAAGIAGRVRGSIRHRVYFV
ncbi:glycosyltransferase [Rhodococcus maanshanensis]|uniref:Glycosyl transferase family 2 n=1 Tax=Rhodococcus maanshanensis TaxID=183556 RepID=A0A1H7PHX8_9NOCA|nr:glycosyltransferase [Rhodococcus maanshanensis]SEL35343.1 Glycosyl transferase family 2 [Rhodococcus maanshanensis]